MGNFIGWLGYDQTPVAHVRQAASARGRQSSLRRWSAAPSLADASGEQPVHAATAYVYDWLVALYSRAIENIDYQHPHDVQPDARQAYGL
jgi:hypothetical protein